MEVKCGREIFTVDENDLILDNGACYQLVTKETGRGWDRYSPRISKALFKELKNKGLIFTNDELKALCLSYYRAKKGLTYWKFLIRKDEG